MSKKTNLHPYPTLVFFTILSLLTLNNDFKLDVHMEEPCLAKFESSAFFDSVVKANLSYGGLIGVQGLSEDDLFLWIPVKDINVYDPSSGLIVFDIGLAYKQFTLSAFEVPPFCVPIGHNLIKDVGRREMKLNFEQ